MIDNFIGDESVAGSGTIVDVPQSIQPVSFILMYSTEIFILIKDGKWVVMIHCFHTFNLDFSAKS